MKLIATKTGPLKAAFTGVGCTGTEVISTEGAFDTCGDDGGFGFKEKFCTGGTCFSTTSMGWTSAALSSNGAYQIPASLTIIATTTSKLEVGMTVTLTATVPTFSINSYNFAQPTCTATVAAGSVAVTSAKPAPDGTRPLSVDRRVMIITVGSVVAANTAITFVCSSLTANSAQGTAVTWSAKSSADAVAITSQLGYTIGAAKSVTFAYISTMKYSDASCTTPVAQHADGVVAIDQCQVQGANSVGFVESKFTGDTPAGSATILYYGTTSCSIGTATHILVSVSQAFGSCFQSSSNPDPVEYSKYVKGLTLDTSVTKIGAVVYQGSGSAVCSQANPTTFTSLNDVNTCVVFGGAAAAAFGANKFQAATDGSVIMTRYFTDSSTSTPAQNCDGAFKGYQIFGVKIDAGCGVKKETDSPTRFCKNALCPTDAAASSGNAAAIGVGAIASALVVTMCLLA
jgi:hypothetical protein